MYRHDEMISSVLEGRIFSNGAMDSVWMANERCDEIRFIDWTVLISELTNHICLISNDTRFLTTLFYAKQFLPSLVYFLLICWGRTQGLT